VGSCRHQVATESEAIRASIAIPYDANRCPKSCVKLDRWLGRGAIAIVSRPPHNGILVALSELLEKAPNLNVPPKVQ
jgi:hypothetical protein